MLKLLEEKLKQEKENSELQRLDEDFFLNLQEHITALKSLKDPISQKKLTLLEEGLEELVELRAEKIMRGHQAGMLKAEQPLAECAAAFKKFKRDVLESLFQKETTTQKVMILQDLPQFYGPEMEVLGPFRRGDVVLLERTVATLLKEKGLVDER